MSAPTDPIRDARGLPMFLCARCARPLTQADFFELGLRTPDPDETHDDYADAELLDEVVHPACFAQVRAS